MCVWCVWLMGMWFLEFWIFDQRGMGAGCIAVYSHRCLSNLSIIAAFFFFFIILSLTSKLVRNEKIRHHQKQSMR